MKFKKLASLLIAGVMAFSMAMPAFAVSLGGNNEPVVDNNGGGGNGGDNGGGGDNGASNQPSDLSRSLKFEGETNVPTINVDMVTETKIILNPYGLPVTVSEVQLTDPVLTSTVYIANKSNCPIDISGSFTPSVEGDAKLVATAADANKGTQASPKDKNVFLAVVMGNVGDANAIIDFGTITGASTYREKMVKATAKTNFGSFSTGGKNASGFYALKEADKAVNFGDANDANTTKKPYTLGAINGETPTYLALRVFGLCEKWVSSEWKAADKVSVSMSMTIVPTSNEA